jgi:hypothetical protein
MSAQTSILSDSVSSARRVEMPPHVFELACLRLRRFNIGARRMAVRLSGAAPS